MFRKLMQGRYGIDQFTIFLLIIILILNLLLPFIIDIMWIRVIEIIVLGYCYVRIFSRNKFKRSQENAKFMRYYDLFKYRIIHYKNRLKEHRNYRFYRCPNCKQQLRVPKGKGRITITCPKCKNRFDKKT